MGEILKKYLISIERAESPRLNSFFSQETFKRYHHDFQKFGVIGANIPTAEYFKLAVASKQRPLSPAELGCTLSHIAALTDFLASDQQYACIFEDDAISIADIDLDVLQAKVAELGLKEKFFLSLGGIQLHVNRHVRGQFLSQTLMDKKVLNVNLLYIRRFSYAYAYIVDRKMAQAFVDYHHSPKVYDHWGELYDEDKQLNFYATHLFNHPELVECAAGQSYLEQERKTLQLKKVRKKSFFERLKISLIKRLYKFTLKKYYS
ncbi:glycosyltransferase family 25 protein [Acinetobacter sp. 251-1]|uniref:glycosyltransferase family 25 protein n=1 Tax=Acinetobacter sp. 251-1 TaxID=2746720 RepID=UPI002575E3D9|nr:glycosyltransferase family 25 protein [Acinetobacter sp. 251-1]